jgi:hypothetical protein
MSNIKGVDNVMIRPSMIDKKDGKVEVIINGKRSKRWPVDAKEIVALGLGKLAGEPLPEEIPNNQNTDDPEESQEESASTEAAPTAAATGEPEQEFEYDVPASAPRRN